MASAVRSRTARPSPKQNTAAPDAPRPGRDASFHETRSASNNGTMRALKNGGKSAHAPIASLRTPTAPQQPRLRRHRHPYARPRHRRHHRHLQHPRRRPSPAAALPALGPPRRAERRSVEWPVHSHGSGLATAELESSNPLPVTKALLLPYAARAATRPDR